ncbi:amino acid adenylation domain-containing protein [Pendulispora rubella]|uniref:Amino acid adenylation domain-containing protein n=1 Tax=Pendulispora rubella TaxID=2741070 RepID=A0ABZ2KSS6_9BACT
MLDQSSRIAQLSAEKRALLQKRLSGKKPPAAAVKIAPRAQRNVAPLSFAQQRLWFLEHWDPGTAVYNVSIPLRISGPLDVSLLERALNKLIERHEVLRTYLLSTFRGEPSQVILPKLTVQIPVVPMSLPEGERDAFLENLIEEESKNPLPLDQAPLFRSRIYQFGPNDHVLFFLIHHIIYDSWSLGIFLREWFHYYDAYARGEEGSLPDLPFQFGDFAAWQIAQIGSDQHRKQVAYWTRQLADRENVLEIPTDHPRPAHLTYRGKLHRFVIPPELKQAIKDLGRTAGTTFYMTTLAAFSVLLYRCTGQSDVIVGTPVAHRPYSETEPLIGYFVNTLPVRVKPQGQLTFQELLRQVQHTLLGALDNLSLPFERVIDELHLERDTSRSPLFQIFFAAQKSHMPPFHTESLTFESCHLDNGTSMFELSAFLYEEGDSDVLQYNSDLFDEETIAMMAERFLVILRAVTEDPTKRLDELPFLAGGERELLAQWSQGPRVELPATCIHRLFEEQAARTPESTAIVCGHESWTYARLDAQANRLARALRKRGVGPETRVGLCIERSPWLLVGLLGILKAGGAYVPLDHEYPRDRLALMLEDARVSLLLVQGPLRGALPECDAPVMDIEHMAEESPESVEDRAAPEHAAYVIYTSGSTGRPKGVEVLHDNVVNFLASMRAEPGLSAGDRLVAVTSISFDIAGLELYLPLVCGATVCIATREQATDGYLLAELLESAQATVLQATPATWRMLLDSGWTNARGIKMLVGGEALPKDLADRLLATGGELWNLYGPTEVTIWATAARISAEAESITIGRPIANTTAYVLDPALQPVPLGGVGDLYLGGRGVARGYLHAPELTAERFVQSPSGERLYRTGDQARLRFDANLEFLGRKDQQVKFHGYRIELEEIDIALREHPAVREAATALREDAPGEARLVAYVVPDASYSLDERSTQQEHVEGWLALYNEVYQQAVPTLNTIGWNSSYTGELISEEEMREQVEHTARRVLALRPERVLELGCGAGLHLTRLAPHTEYYLATDGSASALASLQSQPDLPAHVELQERQAHDLAGLKESRFDCIFINSVIQYFPDVRYLLNVLEQAAHTVLPEGTIVVADVRNRQLLEAYHTSVQLHKAPDGLPCEELRRQIQEQIRLENELLVAPGFFAALREQVPAIGSVEIHLRRGRAHNELTRFRYDALLRMGRQPVVEPAPTWNWSRDALNLANLGARLQEQSPAVVHLERVPDARLAREMKAMALLAGATELRTAGEVRARLDAEPPAGIEPEDIWALGEQLGYHVDMTWSSPDEGADGTYHVTLRRMPARYEAAPRSSEAPAPRPPSFWQGFTNPPRQRPFAELVAEIRHHLQQCLPAYMVPGTIVSIDELPLTPNGKLDRRMLPPPEKLQETLRAAYVEPRNDDERRLAQIWADVLRLERVGRDDDYFTLGGDSVRSILLISRAREAGFVFTSKQLFEFRTVAALLEAMGQREEAPRQETAGPRLPSVEDIAGLVPNLDEVEAVYPTTSYQRWGIRRYQALQDPALYLTQPHYRIRNEQFDPVLFGQAWQQTVALHSALRTGFLWEGLPKPVQVVFKRATPEVNHIDLRHLPYDAQQEALQAYLEEDFQRGFDFQKAPHVRIGLIRLDDDDYVFVYTLDHLLQDGWSMSMFLRDALLHYAALRPTRLEERAPEPASPRPYKDVLEWAWQQDRTKAHEFWRNMLAGFSRPNQLVTYDAPFEAENEALCREVFLTPKLSSGLYDLCKLHQMTFSNFIAGVWSLVVSAETGDDDVVFGLVVSGRPAHMEGIEYTVGNMINLLPLRLRVRPNASFLSWMKELQPVLWEMKNYEYAEALTIWEESDLRDEPLPFQSYITYQSQPLDTYALTTGRHWAQGNMKTARTGIPLKLEVLPIAQIGLRFQYYRDCFAPETIPRMAESFAFLLQLIHDNPRRSLSELKEQLRRKSGSGKAA